ncbi:MAG TPA: hypothetical protein PKG71_04570 [Candidatus Woesebacteria bacterium]|nr:hypothetical protein [Candidatus Woesebacteria bacterium]
MNSKISLGQFTVRHSFGIFNELLKFAHYRFNGQLASKRRLALS